MRTQLHFQLLHLNLWREIVNQDLDPQGLSLCLTLAKVQIAESKSQLLKQKNLWHRSSIFRTFYFFELHRVGCCYIQRLLYSSRWVCLWEYVRIWLYVRALLSLPINLRWKRRLYFPFGGSFPDFMFSFQTTYFAPTVRRESKITNLLCRRIIVLWLTFFFNLGLVRCVGRWDGERFWEQHVGGCSSTYVGVTRNTAERGLCLQQRALMTEWSYQLKFVQKLPQDADWIRNHSYGDRRTGRLTWRVHPDYCNGTVVFIVAENDNGYRRHCNPVLITPWSQLMECLAR